MDGSKRGLNTHGPNGVAVNMLESYNRLGWSVVSGDMSYDASAGKKTFHFHSRSWRDDPVCQEGATGYALRTGAVSGVMAIDVDDPTRPHNQEIIRLCEEAGGVKQMTRKGVHYLFKADDRLRTTTNAKLALDIRNQNALLYIEPSHYTVEGRTQFYKFQNLPNAPEGVPECPQTVVDYINGLFRPVLTTEQKKVIRDTTKRENSGLDKLRVDISKSEADVRTLLQNISVEHAENYSDWIKVGLALHHENLGWELWDEFSRRSPKYREGEPYYVYQSFANRPTEEPISLRTLYWWLKSENEAVFRTLINKEENEEYEAMKKEFETRTCVVGSRVMRKQSNGRWMVMTNGDATIQFLNKTFRKWEDGKMVKQNFYYWWMRDPGRREYERMDFVPPPMVCPPDVFNLYTGFKADSYEPVPEEEVMELVKPILKHLAVLCDGNPDFFLHFLANIVQTPGIKSEVAIVLRDIHRMLNYGGGTGKNLFLEWFARYILGEDYFAIVQNNSELFNPFNEHLESKLLVFVAEAQAKANGKEIDHLKEMITGKVRTINRKGVPKYDQNDFTRYVFGTNNANPIGGQGGTPGDRRFAYYDVDRSKKGDTEYFTQLTEAMANPRVARAFFQQLQTFNCYKNPLEFERHRPLTAARLDMRRMNADPILRWVIDRVEKEVPIAGETSTLFKDFNDWSNARNERSDFPISQSHFTRYLTNNDLTKPVEGERGRYKSNTSHIELNMERVKRELVKHEYIQRDMSDLRDVWADSPSA